MIERYTRPEMGQVPEDAARLLRRHASVTAERAVEIEREVKHDVIAFTTAASEKMRGAGEKAMFELSVY